LPSIERCLDAKKYGYDELKYAFSEYVEKLDLHDLPSLLEGVEQLVGSTPWIGHISVPTSERHVWMMEVACEVLVRLIETRHDASTRPESFALLRRFEYLVARGYHNLTSFKDPLVRLVQGWRELKFDLFWFSVKMERKLLAAAGDKTLTHWIQVYPRDLFKFSVDDFPFLLEAIANKPDLDDRHVALSLVLSMYSESGGSQEWLDSIWVAIGESDELRETIEQFLSKPKESESEKRARLFLEQHEREENERKEKAAMQLEENRSFFRENLPRLRQEVTKSPERLHPIAIQLLQTCQAKAYSPSAWSFHDWKILEPDFGPDVAQFYRDSVVFFWRHHSAQLRSEGAPSGRVTYAVLAGLSGLAIESRENPGWLEGLNLEQIDRACRFAAFEMNGFPAWFAQLFQRYPDEVGRFLLQEVKRELEAGAPNEDSHQIIQSIKWGAEWSWEWMAPHIKLILEKKEPSRMGALDMLLAILRNSSISSVSLARLAAKKCRMSKLPLEHRATWFAVWVGTDPDRAIPNLEVAIDAFPEDSDRTKFAMEFVTRIFGGRRAEKVVAREAFEQPKHLKMLYFLLLRHIRMAEDIDRADGGVYTPELRDRAQEARNAIYGLLERSSGEDAVRALKEISESELAVSVRPWILLQARLKAEQEGDLKPWSPEQVREFQEILLRTPSNPIELGELAVQKVLDLKEHLENGDYSIAGLILKDGVQETDVRNALGDKLQDQAQGRYNMAQEEEHGDAKRPDLKFVGAGFDGRVPLELKLASEPKWIGKKLVERLENQLCGDYLRDQKTSWGIFLLINRKPGKKWKIDGNSLGFSELVDALQRHWETIRTRFPQKEVNVIGIDLTLRMTRSTKSAQHEGAKPTPARPAQRRAKSVKPVASTARKRG